AVSRTLVASLDRDEIARSVRRTLAETMAPAPCLLLLPAGEASLRDAGAGIAVAADDPLLVASPGPGARVVPLSPDASPGARAHDALLATQAHLARADKLASLGRLVAGIAHEINNPVAFVNASVDLIHDAATRLRETLDGNADAPTVGILEQLLENAAICRD